MSKSKSIHSGVSADEDTRRSEVRLDPERKARLRERIMENASRSIQLVRAQEGEWQKVVPGVAVKVLNGNRGDGMQTALWKMQPDTRIPAHSHSLDEEYYVLEGYLEYRGERIESGDYLFAPAGSRHAALSSPEGALILVHGEPMSGKRQTMLNAAWAMGR